MREAHRAGLACYLATGKHHVLNQHNELTAVRCDGMTLPVEVRISLYLLMGKQFLVRSCMISPSEKAEAIHEFEATHDALTGLYNRRGMFNLLPAAIARAKRTQTSLALLYIDLDGFKNQRYTRS